MAKQNDANSQSRLEDADIGEELRSLVHECWSQFRDRGEWPTTQSVVRRLKCPSDELHGRIKEVATASGGYPSLVVPKLEVLLRLVPKSRELLSPVPTILQLAASRFLEHPNYNSGATTCVRLSEVRHLWAPSDLPLGLRLLSTYHLPLTWMGAPDDLRFFPNFFVLQFEKVVSVDEIVAASQTVLLRADESGSPVLLAADKIAAHVRKFAEWPRSVAFGIEHRQIGFWPDLVQSMERARWVRGHFQTELDSRLMLTTAALGHLSGDLPDLILRVVTEMARVWRSDTEPTLVRLDALAATLGLPRNEVAAALLFLESDYWMGSRTLRGPLAEWEFELNESASKLSTFSDWAEYRDALYPERPILTYSKRPFISFSRNDSQLAEALKALLVAVGQKPFHASDHRYGIQTGEGWFGEIMLALAGSTTLILLATPSSVSETWPIYELGVAKGRAIRIVILAVGLRPAELPGPLKELQALDGLLDSDEKICSVLGEAELSSDDLASESNHWSAFLSVMRSTAERLSADARQPEAGSYSASE